MPSKSRRKRGKYSTQSTKKKSRPSRPATVAQTHQPVASPSVSVPTAPVAKPAAVHYPYIATELRTIGILAGIMLIVLVVLALVLS